MAPSIINEDIKNVLLHYEKSIFDISVFFFSNSVANIELLQNCFPPEEPTLIKILNFEEEEVSEWFSQNYLRISYDHYLEIGTKMMIVIRGLYYKTFMAVI